MNTQSIHCDNSSTQTPIVFPFSYNSPILKQSATFNTESTCSPLFNEKKNELPSTVLSKHNLKTWKNYTFKQPSIFTIKACIFNFQSFSLS